MLDYIKYQLRAMPTKKKQSQHPKHYSKIGLKRRQRLVDLVLLQNYSIGRAARRFNIKLSTAKMIVKKYKEQGIFIEKRAQLKNTPNSTSFTKGVIEQKCIGIKQPLIQDNPSPISKEVKKEQDFPFVSYFKNQNQNQPQLKPQPQTQPQPQLLRFVYFEPFLMSQLYYGQGFITQVTQKSFFTPTTWSNI